MTVREGACWSFVSRFSDGGDKADGKDSRRKVSVNNDDDDCSRKSLVLYDR